MHNAHRGSLPVFLPKDCDEDFHPSADASKDTDLCHDHICALTLHHKAPIFMQRTLEIPGLEIHFQHTHQGGMRVTFKGQLSESFRHKDIPSPDTDPVTLDLEGVDFISSVGIREWVLLISEWTKNLRVFYEKCSICFIDQVNMVPDCLGRAQIISFYAPYYCTQCKKEMSSLIDVGVHHSALEQKKAPTVVCPCPQAQKLEFDALEDSYFSFCAS